MQAVPIASQQLRVERSNIPSAASVTLADLIDIDGWSLMPLQGLTIPLPTLTGDSVDLYLHDSIHVNPPGHTLPISLVSFSPPSSNATPTYSLLGVDFYNYSPVVNIPGFDVPLPVLSDEAPADDPDADPLLSVPAIGLEEVTVNGELELSQLQLGLKLVWKDGELGIKVTQTGNFYPFASLPPLQFLFGTLLTQT